MKRYVHEFTPGEDFKQVFRLKDSDGTATDLTGVSALLDFKREGSTVFSFRVSPSGSQGTVTISAGAGTITLFAAAALVETLLAQPAEGTLFVTWADGVKQALLCLASEPHNCDGI